MKKWYKKFYLALIFVIVGAINYFNGKQVISAIVGISLSVAFGFIQLLCERKGEKGKKAYKYISAAAYILLIIWIVYVFIHFH